MLLKQYRKILNFVTNIIKELQIVVAYNIKVNAHIFGSIKNLHQTKFYQTVHLSL